MPIPGSMTAILESPKLRRVGGAARLASRALRSIALLTFAGVLAGSGIAQAQILEYYQLDAVGNVRVVTDQAGNVIERHDYLPFGEETNPTGSQTKRFTGKERDVETGLDYFGARYYGSKIGRFTTTDPVLDLKAALVNPQRWNRYAYVSNNPLRFVDPDGREQATTMGGKVYMGGVDGESAGDNHAKNVMFGVLVGGAAATAAAFVVPALAVEVYIATGTSMVDRAEQIHEAVGGTVTQDKTTVAIARVGAGQTLVASSERALRPAQRALLEAGETAVAGPGHAEVTALNAAKAAGQTVTEVVASRGICPNCAAAIREAGAKIGSALKDKQD